MKNLLIIGGCHFVNDNFIKKLKANLKYQNVKKIFTHLNEESFHKSLQLINREKDYLINNNYQIYFQLGNVLFRNSISNFLPPIFNKLIPTNTQSHLKSEVGDLKNINNNYKVIGYNILRRILKILIFPLNFFYIVVKGFISYNKIKRLIVAEFNESNIIVFTPLYSPNITDNFFRLIGKKIIKYLFSDLKNVHIVDLYELKSIKNNFINGDTHHLDYQGIEILSSFCLENIKSYN